MWQLTFSMLRFRWRTFIAISLAIFGPLAIGSALLELSTVDSMTRWQRVVLDVGFLERADPSAILALFPWGPIAGTLLGSIVIGLLGNIGVAALAHATAITLGGGQPTTMGSLAAAFGALGRLAVLYGLVFLLIFAVVLIGTIIVGLLFLASFVAGSLQPGPLVFGGLIVSVAFIVAVVFVGLRLAFIVQAVVIEGSGAWQSVRRSWRLVSGATWRVLGYLLLFGIVAALPAALISGIAGALIGPAYSRFTLDYDSARVFSTALISGLAAAVFAPISAIALTLLYFDLRSRKGETVPAPGAATATGGEPPRSFG